MGAFLPWTFGPSKLTVLLADVWLRACMKTSVGLDGSLPDSGAAVKKKKKRIGLCFWKLGFGKSQSSSLIMKHWWVALYNRLVWLNFGLFMASFTACLLNVKRAKNPYRVSQVTSMAKRTNRGGTTLLFSLLPPQWSLQIKKHPKYKVLLTMANLRSSALMENAG